MAITTEQRSKRKQYLGSSEIASVMGFDPYRSPADVWLVKTGQASDFEGNEATERGNLLEPVVIDWCEGQIKKESRRNVMRIHANGILCTNFDALVDDGKSGDDWKDVESIEAKTTVVEDGWGSPGTDEIPDRVILQCHMGFACVPSLVAAWVPVLMPGYKKFDFRLYRVERRDRIVAAVERAGVAFMELVRTGEKPTDYKPSLEVLKMIRRQPEKIVPVTDDLVDAWVSAKAALKLAEEDKEQAETALIASLGDGDAGRYSAGIVTYLETHNKGYTKTVEPYSYRSLRIRKSK